MPLQYLLPPCWPHYTHLALPTHTEAEGVPVGTAGAIVHHALHRHHLSGLLGLAVEVTSLLGWKGSSRVLARLFLGFTPPHTPTCLPWDRKGTGAGNYNPLGVFTFDPRLLDLGRAFPNRARLMLVQIPEALMALPSR